MSRFAPLPTPPYYAVIFTSQRADDPNDGYPAMAVRMDALAEQQPGYIGREATRDDSGLGIAVSYWQDEAAVQNWKQQAEHLFAQQKAKDSWYQHYTLRVAKVERGYDGPAGR